MIVESLNDLNGSMVELNNWSSRFIDLKTMVWFVVIDETDTDEVDE